MNINAKSLLKINHPSLLIYFILLYGSGTFLQDFTDNKKIITSIPASVWIEENKHNLIWL